MNNPASIWISSKEDPAMASELNWQALAKYPALNQADVTGAATLPGNSSYQVVL